MVYLHNSEWSTVEMEVDISEKVHQHASGKS